jgi:hypothetical protein
VLIEIFGKKLDGFCKCSNMNHVIYIYIYIYRYITNQFAYNSWNAVDKPNIPPRLLFSSGPQPVH